MGEAAKLQEITEDGKKADAQRGFAQEEIRVKQQVKDAYLKTEKRKTHMKYENGRDGKPGAIETLDRVDLEVSRKSKLRFVGGEP